MELKDCHIGQIVKKRDSSKRIGHITGLEENPMGEVIPIVSWAIKDKFNLAKNEAYVIEGAVHPSNLEPLT